MTNDDGVNRYHSKFGGPESKESGADGKFFAGLVAEGKELFRRPPRFEVYSQLGHLPSQYHAFLCGNLHRGIDGWKVAIEYADKMREVKYPVELIWPEGWDGERKNPFHSYKEYEDVFLRPILIDIAALRELLRKHNVGELTTEEAYKEAASIGLVVNADVKQGQRTDITSRNPGSESQSTRAASNGVHPDTQRKLDRLARDRPDLLDKVISGEMKVNRAAIEAGIVKQPSNLDLAKKYFARLSKVEQNEFFSWISEV